MTFVVDPDPSQFLTVHVYDVVPPRCPRCHMRSATSKRLGCSGTSDVIFTHVLTDTGLVNADVHPCRAAGFTRTLDADPMHGGEVIAGCRASAGIFRECYGEDFRLKDICPLNTVKKEPFITRCCQKDRIGPATVNGLHGTVVHFGAITTCDLRRRSPAGGRTGDRNEPVIHKVAVVEGDGIGHEVIPVALEVLKTFRPDIEYIAVDVGSGRFERTGEAIGTEDISLLKESDAVLFGAVTTPPSPDVPVASSSGSGKNSTFLPT